MREYSDPALQAGQKLAGMHTLMRIPGDGDQSARCENPIFHSERFCPSPLLSPPTGSFPRDKAAFSV
jgi:hypothetical protein